MRDNVKIDGFAYEPDLDEERLRTQMRQVFSILKSTYDWLTVEQISNIMGERFDVQAPEASVSAQIRNLRKRANGGYLIRGRYRKGARIYEYKLIGQADSLFQATGQDQSGEVSTGTSEGEVAQYTRLADKRTDIRMVMLGSWEDAGRRTL